MPYLPLTYCRASACEELETFVGDGEIAGSADGTIRVLGELTFQYSGLAPTDSVPESYYALAEQLDLPVGVHFGLGPPGAAYTGSPKYRMGLSNPLLLEDVLLRHPKLRLGRA